MQKEAVRHAMGFDDVATIHAQVKALMAKQAVDRDHIRKLDARCAFSINCNPSSACFYYLKVSSNGS